MDIDNQLSILEGKSTVISLGSKAIFIKIGVSLLLGIILSYAIRPIYVLNIEYDKTKNECTPSINLKNFSICTVILSICSFFAINSLPYFN